VWLGGVLANDELPRTLPNGRTSAGFYAQVLAWLATNSRAPRVTTKDAAATATVTIDPSVPGPAVSARHFSMNRLLGLSDGGRRSRLVPDAQPGRRFCPDPLRRARPGRQQQEFDFLRAAIWASSSSKARRRAWTSWRASGLSRSSPRIRALMRPIGRRARRPLNGRSGSRQRRARRSAAGAARALRRGAQRSASSHGLHRRSVEPVFRTGSTTTRLACTACSRWCASAPANFRANGRTCSR